MSKIGKGCYQPIKGTVDLSPETIAAICECLASPVGIELSTSQVGCIKDADGVVTGSVFLCTEKSEDGLTSTQVVKALVYATSTVIDPYTGPISACDPVANPVPMALETVCMDVDGVPSAVTPIITMDMANGTVLATAYVDDYGAAIAGAVTAPAGGPCSCTCPDCSEVEACIQMTGFDYYGLADYVAGQTTVFDVEIDGVNVGTLPLDYTVESDGTGKASWYAQLVALVNAQSGWTMSLVADAGETTSDRPNWQFDYAGPGTSSLAIIENGSDVRTISVDAAGVLTSSALDNGNPFGTDPFTACAAAAAVKKA